MRRIGRILAGAAIAVLLSHPVFGAQRYDPRLRFLTMRTPHFEIYFHQGEALLAARLARIAEEVAGELEGTLGRPSSRVRVILVDQSDLSNGWATPVPYDLIEIQAVPPRSESTIGNTDDWLRMVFSHEYTHIVHLDRAGGWIGGLRRVFGRLPLLYPNLFLPQWQIEGVATYEESALTGQGRVPAGDFRMLLDRAAADGRFLPLDRASGGLVDWPSGTAAYLYGGYFHQYLAERFGADRLVALADATARRVPYFGAPAFKKVFGQSLGALWGAFEAETASRVQEEPTARVRVTSHGFNVTAPRYGPTGDLYYAVATPHGFPALMRLAPGGPSPREITSRYLGTRTAIAADWVVFDQLELVRNVGLQSDLYAVPIAGGRTRRLTREARAADPDVSPDGRTIACTVQSTGRRMLATMALAIDGGVGQPNPLVSDEGVEFSSPRWSPDGRTIAAERRVRGGSSDLVLVDVETRTVRTLVSSPPARSVSPEWTRDGTAILFSSDRGGRPFGIYRVRVGNGRVERLVGAGMEAQSPALSPDGRTLAFVGYTADGHDLFALPYDTAQWTDAADVPVAPPTPAWQAVSPSAEATPYRPWRTLLPTFWTPTAVTDDGEFVGGAATGAADALGRHAYVATIGWSASRARPDWSVAYAYDRWWPTVFADYSDDTDPWRDGEVQSREANVGLVLPWTRVRWSQAFLVAAHGSTDAFTCANCSPAVDRDIRRRGARLGWTVSNAKSYGYSIGAEQGSRMTATTEFARRSLGADGDATASTLDGRTYIRAWPRHAVVAARAAWASSWGDVHTRRLFTAGGNGPQPGGFNFGSDAIGLLRGFDEATIVGSRAAVANLDYRFPIAWIQRGAGTLPAFLRTVHGAVFADAGTAWERDFRAADFSRSFGAELSFDVVLGYALPLTFTTGAAWRDGPDRHGVVGFARIGRAF